MTFTFLSVQFFEQEYRVSEGFRSPLCVPGNCSVYVVQPFRCSRLKSKWPSICSLFNKFCSKLLDFLKVHLFFFFLPVFHFPAIMPLFPISWYMIYTLVFDENCWYCVSSFNWNKLHKGQQFLIQHFRQSFIYILTYACFSKRESVSRKSVGNTVQWSRQVSVSNIAPHIIKQHPETQPNTKGSRHPLGFLRTHLSSPSLDL